MMFTRPQLYPEPERSEAEGSPVHQRRPELTQTVARGPEILRSLRFASAAQDELADS